MERLTMKLITILCAILFISAFAFAQIPRYISHQGFLTRSTGEPYDTTIAVTLKLYVDSTTTTNLYGQTINSVVVTKGIFNVTMGPVSLPFDQQYWLEVTAGSQVLSPRIKLTSSAYALRADTAEVAKSTQSVAARYTGGTTVFGGASGLQTLVFTAKEYDTHNAYSNGIFTCPVAGLYQVVAQVYQNAQTQTAGESALLMVYKNNSEYCTFNNVYGNGQNVPYIGSGTAVVKCLAGDQLTVKGSNNSGARAMLDNFSYTWVAFTRIGN